jgi:probable rRNA maturation factor
MVIVDRPMAGISEAALERFLARAKSAAGLRGSVSVLITSSRELRSLNQRFRRKNRTTDVLSFPPLMTNHDFAGDVAISLDIAAENARLLGHTTADEVKILMLHGVLHLAGYDHETDGGQMKRKENRLRKKLGLPSGLIERSEGPSVKARTKKRIRRRSRGVR